MRREIVSIAFLFIGMIVIISAVAVDWLGYGYAGFGKAQTLLAIIGFLLLTGGVLLQVDRKKWLPKLPRLYTNVALLLLNTVLLVLGINGILWAAEVIFYPETSPPVLPETKVRSIYSSSSEALVDFEVFQKIHPDLTDGEIIRLKLESWNVPFVCDSKILYREQAMNGQYITVDPAGFRWGAEQFPWPPLNDNINIFVFGGSTTFGYGETNSHTIPAYLQKHLQESSRQSFAVYNFGHASFFSLQERLAFEALVQDGFVPDLAVFIDGLNEFYYWDGQPAEHTCSLNSDFLNRLYNTVVCQADEFCWPHQRWISRFVDFLARKQSNSLAQLPVPPPDDGATNLAVINRWIENKQYIEELAGVHNIQTLFVMQPVPGYAYDLTYHPFKANDINNLIYNSRATWGYALWEAQAKVDTNRVWTDNFLNLSHLGENKQAILYLDRVHYTRFFMDEIARHIADKIIEDWSE